MNNPQQSLVILCYTFFLRYQCKVRVIKDVTPNKVSLLYLHSYKLSVLNQIYTLSFRYALTKFNLVINGEQSLGACYNQTRQFAELTSCHGKNMKYLSTHRT